MKNALFTIPAILVLAALHADAARGPRGPRAPKEPAGPVLLWHCDERGAAPTLADASGGGRAGEPAGGVRGGAQSPSGLAAGAFADETCSFSAALPVDAKGRPETPREWTFQCFLRDPMPLTNRVALVARGAGEGKEVPWQLWIERSGAVCLGIQDSKGGTGVERAEGFAWKRGTWYHVAVVRALESKKDDETWDEHYRVWIGVPGDPVGEPVLDRVFRNGARAPAAERLVVGGAPRGRHPKSAPAGALGPAALVDEVSLWPRSLSAEEMTAARAAFLAGGAAAAGAAAGKGGWDKTLLLRWEFEEAGKAPTAADSSNEKRDGSAKDRVRGGAPGRRSGAKAYDGFGSEGSFVLSGPLPENAFRQEWTLAMWMKNPRLSSKQACVLAGAAPDAKTGDFGWQVWLDAKGVPHVAMQDAKGRRHAAEGKPFRWEPNKWHLVVIAHLPDRDEFKQPSNRFRVWIVPETGAVPEALFDGLCGWGAAMESGIAQLQVGAAQPGKGKRSEIAPGGYFGGLIDDVAFYLGAAAVQADVETLRAGPAR